MRKLFVPVLLVTALMFAYSPIGHVAIYVGGGLMIHAPYTGAYVSLRRVNWDKIVGVSRPV